MKNQADLQHLIASIPHNPGVYQYFDENGKIIYVGKAKDLKKRVSTYFNKNQIGKVRVLVGKIADIQTIVVGSETDALLLENNLIKKFQPRYNILLKDDKTFPWICIKNEAFPRIFSTRNVINDGSEYFGPYASVRIMSNLLSLIRQLFPIRNCSLRLNDSTISRKQFKICLEYHLGNCKGPCEGLQSEGEYNLVIKGVREIIKGNLQMVQKQLHSTMMDYAASFEFEKAQMIKERLDLLEKYRSKSVVVSADIGQVDVVSIIDEPATAFVNFLKVTEGAIVQSHSVEMKKKLDETAEEILSLALADFQQRFFGLAPEVIVPFIPDFAIDKVKYTIPQRGDKKHLLDLSEQNARHFKLELEKQRNLVDPERHQKRILNQMKTDLRMPVLPEVIECFDNSNFQGDYAVAAMVQFKNAKPNKNEYRHFNIKTVVGPDDFASMEEIITRRYKRLMEEQKPLPQLIVIDGGKGQLGAAVNALEKLGLRGKITIVGIAKKLEEIYFPGDSLPLYIDKRSESLKVIQFLRDEAHRFGITHHRKKFEKGVIKSELTDIKGIGKDTAQKLLWKFKSVKKIKEATPEEIIELVGKSRAQIVIDYFAENELSS
ncbi:MAG: excinuclease ABC subunit UvrC [Bacteroidales bacterium]